jgi:AraC-like DNA-binding protein
MAGYLCSIGEENQIVISSRILELYKEDWEKLKFNARIKSTTVSEENFLKSLINTLNENWQNQNFNTDHFSKKMSMSKSQLYRKCTALTGMSPITFLREYRLLKSLQILDSDRNIMQTTFDIGFGNPSYFTKCFYKKFGLHPKAYVKELD